MSTIINFKILYIALRDDSMEQYWSRHTYVNSSWANPATASRQLWIKAGVCMYIVHHISMTIYRPGGKLARLDKFHVYIPT